MLEEWRDGNPAASDCLPVRLQAAHRLLPPQPPPPAARRRAARSHSPPRRGPCLQHTIYQSRLLNFFGTFANECASADRAAFVEALLDPLVKLSYAKDATARWRFCQLLHALMGNLPPESELSDALLDGFQDAMTERLEDSKPTIRAVAVRALARLPDPGPTDDFSDCQLTASLIEMLGAEKSKAVRKAVLATLPFSDFTRAYYMQRTRDEADDVRGSGMAEAWRLIGGAACGLGAANSCCCKCGSALSLQLRVPPDTRPLRC